MLWTGISLAYPFCDHGLADIHNLMKGEGLRKILLSALVVLSAGAFVIASADEGSMIKKGETEFNEHCVACHPGGGNIINAQKTLHKKDLESNNIRTPEDIVKIIRKPGTGMPPFDENSVTEKEAKAIGEYILRTFW